MYPVSRTINQLQIVHVINISFSAHYHQFNTVPWGIHTLVELSIIDCGPVFSSIETFIIFFYWRRKRFQFLFDCIIDKIICICIFLLMSQLHIGKKTCIKVSVFILGLTNWDLAERNRFSSNRYLDDFIRYLLYAIIQFFSGKRVGLILSHF